ncbi:MAG: N-acetylmannosamine-6-phosphate 2-epimerase [Firmicutes bacterium]|nr:N-acetylmannosamine-6-phosphate 2-epimerase [Bacillota bacterium]
MDNIWQFIPQIRGGLIVSCQAQSGEPLYGSHYMAAMARAAREAGAVAVRAESPRDIQSIKAAVGLPVIGLWKVDYPGSPVYITPTLKEVAAVDATAQQPRPDSLTAADFIKAIKKNFSVPVMADISTVEEGVKAEAAGADLVSTTLAGYTPYSRQLSGPDFTLVQELHAALKVPVVAEGRIWHPAEAAQALKLGAHAVVVGSAITRPQEIARRFVQALRDPCV